MKNSWFSELDRAEKDTFWGCFAGWALDAFDVQLYSLVIPVLLTLNFVHSTAEAGLIATVALLSSAVGGWLAGVLSDRIGRARTLQLTVLWFSAFTALSAFAQSSGQLMAARALMGFGFGGEWAAGAVLMGEVVRARYRGRAVGSVQSGWAIGWGAAVLAFMVMTSTLPAHLAWRGLFLLGILPALLVIFLRKRVHDPEAVQQSRREHQTGGGSLVGIFRPEFLRATLLCSLLAVGAQGGYYALTTWLPQFLAKAHGLKLFALGGTLAIIIAGAFLGYLFGAWFTDRVGRRMALVWTSLGAVAVVLPFTLLNLPNAVFTILCLPLGFFSSAYFSGIGAFFSEQFPTHLRGSGQGFAYNVGRGFGALFPFLVGRLAEAMGIGVAISIFACAAYGVMAIAAVLLPETRGVEITHDA